MRIYVHIGLPGPATNRLQHGLEEKRGRMLGDGVLFAQSPGKRNHTRLYMAVSDPGHVDMLRFYRGFTSEAKQAELRQRVSADLAREVEKHQPDTLILSASQLGTLPNRSELERMRTLLLPISEDIRIVAHVDDPARMAAHHYAQAIGEGRTAKLERDLALIGKQSYRRAALADWGKITPRVGGFPEVQGAPHWIDLAALDAEWSAVFGAENVRLRCYDRDRFFGSDLGGEIRDSFDIDTRVGQIAPADEPRELSLETLVRARLMNEILVKLSAKGRIIPRQLWRRFLDEVSQPGDPLDPGRLHALSGHFAEDIATLSKRHPTLVDMTPPAMAEAWTEPAPARGFRATQYAAAFLPRIEQATREAQKEAVAKINDPTPEAELTPTAEALMSDRAKENFFSMRDGRFAPHNRLGRIDETAELPPYDPMPERVLPEGSTGNVIVGCMKNEAPYILEWVAYHRAIGVDNFLIYTNDCTDGTDEILGRLQEMGLLQHRNNDAWKGNSPQQHALNQSLKEPLIENAEWVIHIDVDEFMNIRCGNGTLDDFFDRVPNATNVAMTWRLFGHNGVTEFKDDLVIDQFDAAAPKFCPKPHTVWGFKTMTRNTGAYQKLSCHRPNKLRDDHRGRVQWVNGSGVEMSESYKDKGWRSDLRTIGYDLLQLNHYALRSAESFLVKRQRGRALHVDRSIGINYWVRMDWSGNRDVTIKRNIPRVQAELDRLKADPELNRLHQEGVHWHRAKADELHQTEEFEELYQQALATDLTEMERVAFALALDMES